VTEDEQLMALVVQAFDLRGTPYLTDACQAVVAWFERRHLRRLEHEQIELAALQRLLRECQP
jgi:hypothetical protein